MNLTTRKRTARVKLTLNKRTIESLRPAAKPWIAWDDKLTGFGVRVQPSGTKAFVVNFRTGSGGRKAPNRRVVIGRYGAVAPDQARRLAQELLGRVAVGGDPARERAARRRLPTLAEAFEEYLAANPGRKRSTETLYRGQMRYCLGDWLSRPLDAISRQDVEARFNQVSARHGWAVGNHAISLLRSVYRRSCVDFEALRNPVALWLAGGGRYHRPVRRRISTPAEVLPRWRAGIESEVVVPATRDIFWFGMYTGMRRGEITALRWDRVDLERRVLRIEETKTGEPLELPITRQLGALFARRGGEVVGGNGGGPGRNGAGPGGNGAGPAGNGVGPAGNGVGPAGNGVGPAGNGVGPAGPPSAGWVFPSTSASGHMEELQHLYGRIGRVAGTKFWFHGLRNAFITVAERELMLPRSLTKRLVNHARRDDVTQGYAADWSIEQLRGPAQRIADRIEALARAVPGAVDSDEDASAAG